MPMRSRRRRPPSSSDDIERYLRLTAAATLQHEEHGPIAIAPGTYRVVIQREYVPAPSNSPAWRRVID